MIHLYSCILLLFLSVNSYTQYCTAVGPTTNADSNLESFYLSGESSTAINFIGCPGVIGLDDQTLMQGVLLSAGSSYTALAQFGTCGGNFYGVGEAWIDYNQNQVFEASESIGIWSGTPPVAVSVWNFTVPVGAISGSTRMRVVQYESGTLPIDPCAIFTWGSTTDFTVQIGGGMDCSGYIGESTDDPRIISALPYSENYNNSICYFNVLPVYASADVFYRILPQQLTAEFLTISLCGSVIDTYLTVLDENDVVKWYNDDNSICGTGSKLHFNASGEDTLYIVVQGWGYEMGDYSILVEEELAAVEENIGLNFKLYPNPAQNFVTIQTPVVGALISITDISGKLVYQEQSTTSQTEINLENFSEGTYFVKMTG
ncbi:MAG: T9SS type A sorting domain-containing protein, partial [Crocinitomicaceae bacterium]|nr:T9SS type A sorting domain-containing protein [Crocinitomicaceae bacterium]